MTATGRGSAATELRDGGAWTSGNEAPPLAYRARYFPELLRCVDAMPAGDLLLFPDDPRP